MNRMTPTSDLAVGFFVSILGMFLAGFAAGVIAANNFGFATQIPAAVNAAIESEETK